MLQNASQASKPRDHVSLLVALATMGGYKQAEDMLISAMKDDDVDIRLAAVASAGTTGDHALIPALRIAMEFRHVSCFATPTIEILKQHQVAMVIPHSTRFPIPEAIATAPTRHGVGGVRA